MKKILLSAFCVFVFFGCGDSGDSDSKNDLAEPSSSKSYLVEFSQEELKNENYIWAFNKIKKELRTDNLKFYKLESIRYLYPRTYSDRAQVESRLVPKLTKFLTHIYVVDEYGADYLYMVDCSSGVCKKSGRILNTGMELDQMIWAR